MRIAQVRLEPVTFAWLVSVMSIWFGVDVVYDDVMTGDDIEKDHVE
jgi:hypothetical protein